MDRDALFLGGRNFCLVKHYVMKTCGGGGVVFKAVLTSAMDEGKWSTSRHICFPPRLQGP